MSCLLRPSPLACAWVTAFAVNAAMVESQWRHCAWTVSLHRSINIEHEAGQTASPVLLVGRPMQNFTTNYLFRNLIHFIFKIREHHSRSSHSFAPWSKPAVFSASGGLTARFNQPLVKKLPFLRCTSCVSDGVIGIKKCCAILSTCPKCRHRWRAYIQQYNRTSKQAFQPGCVLNFLFCFFCQSQVLVKLAS